MECTQMSSANKTSELYSQNNDVDDLNSTMLNAFPGQEQTFFSQDSVTNDHPASGIPLAKLQLKIGCPVMVLRNLYPADGVCNGTREIVKRMSPHVIEIECHRDNQSLMKVSDLLLHKQL